MRIIYYSFATVMQSLSSILPSLYLAKFLPVEVYAQFGILYALLAMSTPVILLGQPTAITSILFGNKHKNITNIGRELWLSNTIIFFNWFLLAIFFIIYICIYVDCNYFILIFVALAMASIINLQNFLYIRDQYYIFFGSSLIQLIIVICCLFFYSGLDGFFYGIIFSGLFFFLLINIFCRFKYSYIRATKYNIFRLRNMFQLGWFAIPGTLIGMANTYFGRLILDQLVSLHDLAIYTLASVLGLGVGNLIISIVLKNSTIQLLKSFKVNNLEAQLAVKSGVRIIIYVSFLTFIGYILFGEKLINIIWGDKYYHSVSFILPILIITLMGGLIHLYIQPLIILKEMPYILKINFLSLIVNILFAIFFTYFIGILGPILGVFFGYLFSIFMISNHLKSNNDFGVKPMRPVLFFTTLLILSCSINFH